MALLFSRTAAGAVDDPEFGHFEPDPDSGGFEFPDDLSDRLLGIHYRGKPAWEDETGRAQRLHEADLARRRDPAMLYDAVGEFSGALKHFTGQQASAEQAAEIEDLKRQLAELRAAQPPADTETKPPVSRRTPKA